MSTDPDSDDRVQPPPPDTNTDDASSSNDASFSSSLMHLASLTQALRAEYDRLDEAEPPLAWLYADLLRQAPFGHLVLDEQGVILDVNETVAQFLACDPEALIQQSLVSLVREADQMIVRQHLRTAYESAAPETLTLDLLRRDDQRFQAHLTTQAIFDAAGQFTRYQCAVIDDTEASSTRAHLRTSEARLRRAVREAPLPIGIHADDGEILLLSNVWTEITGYTPEDIPTIEAWVQRAYGKRGRDMQAIITELYDLSDRKHEGIFEVRTHDGSIRYWDFFSSPLGRLPDGRRAAISIALDVTETHQAEEKLNRRALQQAIIADLGQRALSGLSLPTLFQQTTEQVAKGLDVPLCKVLELLPDKPALRLVAGVGWKPGLVGTATVGTELDSQAGYTLVSDEPVIVENLRLETRFNGPALLHDHDVTSGLSVVIQGFTKPFGVLGAHIPTFRRFTEDDVHFLVSVSNVLGLAVERHQTEQQLIAKREEAEQVAAFRSMVLNSLSHDLRTPLTGIIGFAAVLAEEIDEPHREFAKLIASSGQRLIDMLNAVLEYGKLEAGRMELQPEPTDVLQEVHEVIALMQPLADEKQLALRLHVPDQAVQASVDPAALSRILINLIGNAIKFTDEGHVTVSVHTDAHYVYLEVQDTGKGIAPTFKADLFKAFHQERRGISRSHEGAGLGLSISKRLTERMGGTIEVDSTLNEGSTFRVTFPTLTAEHQQPPVTPRPAAPTTPVAPVARERVLVVEDNLETQRLIQYMLQDLYDLTVATTPPQARQIVQEQTFDLVLLDISLGHATSGIDLLQEIQALPAYNDVPCVALTAHALPGDRERFLGIGFDAYMSKPFTRDKLLRLVHGLLVSPEVK